MVTEVITMDINIRMSFKKWNIQTGECNVALKVSELKLHGLMTSLTNIMLNEKRNCIANKFLC